jgi:hypothetical protein
VEERFSPWTRHYRTLEIIGRRDRNGVRGHISRERGAEKYVSQRYKTIAVYLKAIGISGSDAEPSLMYSPAQELTCNCMVVGGMCLGLEYHINYRVCSLDNPHDLHSPRAIVHSSTSPAGTLKFPLYPSAHGGLPSSSNSAHSKKAQPFSPGV